MFASLIGLGLLSIGLAYLWHWRISGFRALFLNIKSKFDDGNVERSLNVDMQIAYLVNGFRSILLKEKNPRQESQSAISSMTGRLLDS